MKEYNKILIPVDGSAHAVHAAQKGISMAKFSEAEVLGIYVIDLMYLTEFPEDGQMITLNTGLKEEGKAALKTIEDIARSEGVSLTGLVVEGHPSEEILRIAEEESVDMIVMGTKGRSGLKRLLLGSVAENVVRHAHCSVKVVRPDATKN